MYTFWNLTQRWSFLFSRNVFTESTSPITILNVQFSEETSFPVSGWWPKQCCVVLWYRIIIALFGFISRNVNLFRPLFHLTQLRVYPKAATSTEVYDSIHLIIQMLDYPFCVCYPRHLFIITGWLWQMILITSGWLCPFNVGMCTDFIKQVE